MLEVSTSLMLQEWDGWPVTQCRCIFTTASLTLTQFEQTRERHFIVFSSNCRRSNIVYVVGDEIHQLNKQLSMCYGSFVKVLFR